MGLWRSWERASMAWKRSRVRIPSGPPNKARESAALRKYRTLPDRADCGKLVPGVVPALMSPAARRIVSNLTGVLVQAARPKRIILFGSQARGDAAPHSDFDIMVVEEKPADRFAEMVRLNRLIRSFDIAVDLLVVSDEKFQYWRETPGNVYYEAATGGQVLYQAA